MKLNLNKFLFSVSFALDLAEGQIVSVSKLHSKRVAFISLELAKLLGLSEDEKFDLYAYALLHDNGLVESFSKQEKSNLDENIIIDEDFKDHCLIGEKNIQYFPFLTKQENIILYHHEHYDGSGYFGKKGDDIPLMSQIIFLANIVDENLDKEMTLASKEKIDTLIRESKGKELSALMVDTFLKLSKEFAFWGSLEYFYILNHPDKLLKDIEINVSIDQFYDIVYIFSEIVDAKSHYTAVHSQELYRKTKILLEHFNFDELHRKKMLIAANLHDIGKLATPLSILEKKGPLTDEELFEIKKHAFFTFKILDGIDFCDDILTWASYHHEQPDGSGYPFGKTLDDLSIETRLISCLDFYQALVEDRPYRDAMSHENAINIMKVSLKEHEIDMEIVGMIDKVFLPY
jgi:HD-GYP domain-containing protein (c-di-GMP phosphodiesterase class II)